MAKCVSLRVHQSDEFCTRVHLSSHPEACEHCPAGPPVNTLGGSHAGPQACCEWLLHVGCLGWASPHLLCLLRCSQPASSMLCVVNGGFVDVCTTGGHWGGSQSRPEVASMALGRREPPFSGCGWDQLWPCCVCRAPGFPGVSLSIFLESPLRCFAPPTAPGSSGCRACRLSARPASSSLATGQCCHSGLLMCTGWDWQHPPSALTVGTSSVRGLCGPIKVERWWGLCNPKTTWVPAGPRGKEAHF